MTSGPLLFLHADGRMPGEEVTLGAGGALQRLKIQSGSYVLPSDAQC